jgi:hypothetical protein
MENSAHELPLPSAHGSEEGREEARLKAITLVRQAVEQAALADHAPEATRLCKIADRLEVNRPRRKRQQSGSLGQRARAAARKRGALTFKM